MMIFLASVLIKGSGAWDDGGVSMYEITAPVYVCSGGCRTGVTKMAGAMFAA